MRRRHRQDRQQKNNIDRWLLTYADMITLLMAFFIVLYAMSQLDVSKFQQLRIALANEFSNPNLINLLEPAPEGAGADDGLYQGDEFQSGDDQEAALNELYHQLAAFISQYNLEDKVLLNRLESGISLSLQEVILFDTGKAHIKPEGRPYLETITDILLNLNNPVVIEGHTDARPINTYQYPSNWELAADRALTVLHFMEDKGMDPARLQIAAFAEYQPVDEHDLSRNRRVDIIILRNDAS